MKFNFSRIMGRTSPSPLHQTQKSLKELCSVSPLVFTLLTQRCAGLQMTPQCWD